MGYHIVSFLAGFILDLLLGDPYWPYHPVRLMGALIGWLEHRLLKTEEPRHPAAERLSGLLMVLFVLSAVGAVTAAALITAYALHPWIGAAVESVMTYQALAARCLKDESMKVYERLAARDLPGARHAVSMIVGRDTKRLSETGVAKAAVETVAENTSDGVIAPMLFLAAGGPVLGFLYKAVNTMDSMVGYRSKRYLYFGRAAARLDDLVNFLPARISALLLIAAAGTAGKQFSGREALRIFLRDRGKHTSPNAGQTEAACAGALGVRLAGDASYFGKVVKKPFLGDEKRSVEPEDIPRVNRLMYQSVVYGELLCLAVLLLAEYRQWILPCILALWK